MSEITVLIPELIGVYIPYNFAWNFAWNTAAAWDNIDPEDIMVCQSGPGHPEYWEAWENILLTATFTDGSGEVWRLQQEGDLLAYTGDGEEFV